ncbi:hypothetical protein C7C46_01190 [Streptomyces tateyamensis]|uniref:SalK n=1 Tax=Streptomyces tateyamensis TaxID=565073 RepID=A0A2V4PPL2_9ACTN|nr:hypothetical protein [Streptomyces tateyamensis]PYC88290.1 hypothetical protein C7C46_01190 [Streptomyces tateyamensis]
MTLLAGRRCYNVVNPLHSMVYFAPETQTEFTALGLERGAMSYFAGRAAAMGRVGAGVVAGTFYNFNPALIARHVPALWEIAAPEQVLAARLRAVAAAQQRTLGAELLASAELAEAAELALRASQACAPAGRPLYAAHAELAVPEEPGLRLWHAATLLREHRGDGHLAALLDAELDGLEALISHTATGKGFLPEAARATRGWSEQEWAAAEDRLRSRGLLDAVGELTEAGEQLRQQIEERTDRLAVAPYQLLGEAGVARLTELAGKLTAATVANGAFPGGVFATDAGRR